MLMYKCPHCEAPSIPLKSKYWAGQWGTIHCKNCMARLCVYPWLLAGLYFFYVWNVVWWFGMYHFTNNYYYLAVLILGWIVLDLINLAFLPLALMRRDQRR